MLIVVRVYISGEEESSQEDLLWVKRTDVDTGKGGIMKQSSSAASAPRYIIGISFSFRCFHLSN